MRSGKSTPLLQGSRVKVIESETGELRIEVPTDSLIELSPLVKSQYFVGSAFGLLALGFVYALQSFFSFFDQFEYLPKAILILAAGIIGGIILMGWTLRKVIAVDRDTLREIHEGIKYSETKRSFAIADIGALAPEMQQQESFNPIAFEDNPRYRQAIRWDLILEYKGNSVLLDLSLSEEDATEMAKRIGSKLKERQKYL